MLHIRVLLVSFAGNNIYGDDIRLKLDSLRGPDGRIDSQAAAEFILMQRIFPPRHLSLLVRGGVLRQAMPSLTHHIWWKENLQGDGWKISFQNARATQCGYLSSVKLHTYCMCGRVHSCLGDTVTWLKCTHERD